MHRLGCWHPPLPPARLTAQVFCHLHDLRVWGQALRHSNQGRRRLSLGATRQEVPAKRLAGHGARCGSPPCDQLGSAGPTTT